MLGLYEKAKKAIQREKMIEAGDLVIVAVSGGPDSLALLDILNRLREEKEPEFSLYVAHLNHGLRGKSAEEDARFVRQEAKRMGLPCTVGEVDAEAFKKRRGLSLEDAARRLRYRFLQQLAKRIGAASVALGHNRDDQVETVLLNFLRGTGLSGLSGMKIKRTMGQEGLLLIRPLLEAGKEEIYSYCRERGLNPRLDETNVSLRYVRNKIRLELLPYLEREYNPGLRQNLIRLSQMVSQDQDYLEGRASERLSQLIFKEDDCGLVLDGEALVVEHQALRGRILRQAIARLMGMIPREIGHDHIRSIIKLCQEGSPHGMLHLPCGLKVSRSYGNLTLFFKEPLKPRVFTPIAFKVPGKINLPGTELVLEAEIRLAEKLTWPPDGKRVAYLDYDRVLRLAGKEVAGEGEDEQLFLKVRGRQPGDSFYPLGAPGRKKIKSFFIDQKVPLQEREFTPLVVAGEEIIWVAGKQISHLCRITEETKRALVLRIGEK